MNLDLQHIKIRCEQYSVQASCFSWRFCQSINLKMSSCSLPDWRNWSIFATQIYWVSMASWCKLLCTFGLFMCRSSCILEERGASSRVQFQPCLVYYDGVFFHVFFSSYIWCSILNVPVTWFSNSSGLSLIECKHTCWFRF